MITFTAMLFMDIIIPCLLHYPLQLSFIKFAVQVVNAEQFGTLKE